MDFSGRTILVYWPDEDKWYERSSYHKVSVDHILLTLHANHRFEGVVTGPTPPDKNYADVSDQRKSEARNRGHEVQITMIIVSRQITGVGSTV